MKRWLTSLHRNTDGAIGILMLLTIWCLVALIGMIWNNAEYAMRRQQVQNAADTAAHDSALWMSRTLNAVTGQNMAICRDASAEAIWRAAISTGGSPSDPNYPANAGSIAHELNRELADATAGRTRVRNIQQRLQTLCTRIEAEYELTHTALQTLNASPTGNFSDDAAQKTYANNLRQANSALNWVENTYLNGQSLNGLSAPARPGPPGPGGQGLYQLVATWNIDTTKERAIFDFITDYINTVEFPLLQIYQDKTFDATSQPVDTMMQEKENDLFTQQQSERTSTITAIDQQKQQVQDFYNSSNKTDLQVTLATTKQLPTDADGNPIPSDNDEQLGLAGSGSVGAPIAAPEEPQGIDHVDGIRTSGRVIPFTNAIPPLTYAREAQILQLPPEFTIDPINPQTIAHAGITRTGQQWEDATIWHPDMPIMLPNGSLFVVRCNVPGGWGHLWLMPIERQLNERIWNDQAHLRSDYIVPIDRVRWQPPHTTDLAGLIWKMQGLPASIQIAALPSNLPDDTPNPQGGYDTIRVLPTLQNPPNAQSSFNSEVSIYNTHSQSYLSFIRQLRTTLFLYQSIYEEFYVPFAVLQWDGAVNAARNAVMGATPLTAVPQIPGLAQNGTFMILSTYKLRKIPQWADGEDGQGMKTAIQEQVAEHIIEMNMPSLIQQLGGTATGAAIRPFADEAIQILHGMAEDAGEEIAEEWVQRPWPYEIAPPNANSDLRPPLVPLGIPKTDRQNFFSAIAAVVNNNAPKMLFPPFFATSTPLTAYAQGEAFNWMEFNPDYGGNEQFDNATRLPYGNDDSSGTYFGEIGCPRGWRLSTTGGWNWQPRLSVADALPQAISLNPELQQLFPKVTVPDPNSSPLIHINMH